MTTSGTEKGTADNLATRLGLAPGAAAVSTLERQVRGERIRLMAERSTRESVLAAAFALAAAALLWPAADPLPLLVWLALTQLPSAARTLVERSYHQMPSDVRDSRHPYWAHRFSACSAASGTVWGGVVVLLPSAGSAEVALLIGLHAAYLAFAAGILTAWLPAFLGFALSSTLAFLAVALIAADAVPVQGAALLIVAGAGSALCAHGGARSLVDTLRVRLRARRAGRASRRRARAGGARAGGRTSRAGRSEPRPSPAGAGARPVRGLASLEGAGNGGGRGGRQDPAVDRRPLGDDRQRSRRLDARGGRRGTARTACRAPVALEPLLARVVLDHELQARAKGLSLSIDGRADLIAQADPVQLARVLMNLVGNAIKFTERGGVVVTARPDGERVSLSVRDTGRGIAESERQRVFAEYHQSRQADRAAGQGLGLAIVKRLCARMDVSIELVSAPGKGSEFRLSIPRGAADRIGAAGGRRPDGDARAVRVPEIRMPKARKTKSRTVKAPARASIPGCRPYRHAFVVDAERDALGATRATLAGRGWRVTAGRSAAEAVRRHVREHDDAPDVLILDVGPRGLEHGLDAARAVREEFNVDVPVLLITEEASVDVPTSMADVSIRVLRKPYAPARLHRELAALPAGEPSLAAA